MDTESFGKLHIDKFDWSPEGMLANSDGDWMKKEDVLDVLERLLEYQRRLTDGQWTASERTEEPNP
jgi:hypothetical protein